MSRTLIAAVLTVVSLIAAPNVAEAAVPATVTVRAKIVTPTGEPVLDASLRAGTRGGASDPLYRVDGVGVVEVAVTPGRYYYFQAFSPSFQPGRLLAETVGSTGLDLGDVVVQPLGVVDGAILLGGASRPAADSEIRVTAENCTEDLSSCGQTRETTSVGGRFRLLLPDGHYRISAYDRSGRDYQVQTAVVTVAQGDRDHTLDFALASTRTLSGTVRLGSEGRLAEAGEVEVALPGYYGATFPTDGNGRFSVPGLSDGEQIFARFDYVGDGSYLDTWVGDVPSRETATPVTISGDTEHDITLGDGGTISGTVVTPDPRGPREVGVRVDSVIDDSRETRWVTPAADGTYVVDGLWSGSYFVGGQDTFSSVAQIGTWGETNASEVGEPVEVVGGRTTSGIDVRMRHDTSVSGALVCTRCEARGSNLGSGIVSLEVQTPHGWVAASPQPQEVSLTAAPLEPARYSFPRVLSGTYRVVLTSGTDYRARRSEPFEVVEGTPVVVADLTFWPVAWLPRDFGGDGAPDVLVVKPNGSLVDYRASGTGGWNGSVAVGSGWQGFTAVFSPGDFDGLGTVDVVARDAAGKLWLYRGNGGGGWWPPRQQIGSGWQKFTAIFSPGDFDGDGDSDVLARDPQGKLWLYRGDGRGGWDGSKVVGSGWNGFDRILGPGDFDGDGAVDVLARRPNGDLMLYRGDGYGSWKGSARIGSGWQKFTAVASVGDFDGKGGPDVLARDKAGALWLYPTNGDGAWLKAAQVGSGWNGLTIIN